MNIVTTMVVALALGGPICSDVDVASADRGEGAWDAEAVTLLDGAVEATGGAEAWKALSSLRLSGVYTGSHLVYYDADELPFVVHAAGADRWHRAWPESGISETMLPDEGWLHYPGRGVPDQPALQHAFFLRELPGARARWRCFWSDAEYVGPAELDGKERLAVRLHAPDAGLTVTRYFDPETGLHVASSTPAGEHTAWIRYREYAPVGEVAIARMVVVDIGPETHHEYRVHDAAADVEVDPEIFVRPGEPDVSGRGPSGTPGA